MTLYVRQPGSLKSTSSILDLIFSTQPSYVCNVDVFPGISDHEAIRFKLVNNIIKKEFKKKKGIFLFQRQLWKIPEWFKRHYTPRDK